MKWIWVFIFLIPLVCFSADKIKVYHGLNEGLACVINENDKLFCWGESQLLKDFEILPNYKEILPTEGYVCGLSKEGVAKCVGGVPQTETQHKPGDNLLNFKEEFKLKTPIDSMALEFFNLCFLTQGKVFCRGMNGPGVMAEISLPFPAKKIIPASSRICAILTSGSVYCWSTRDSKIPEKVPFDQKITDAPYGGWDLCALNESGKVSCWDFVKKSFYNISNLPSDIGAFSFTVGYSVHETKHCAINKSGEVYCWDKSPAVKINGIQDAIQVEVTRVNTCVVIKDGTMKCWDKSNKVFTFVPPQAGADDVED